MVTAQGPRFWLWWDIRVKRRGRVCHALGSLHYWRGDASGCCKDVLNQYRLLEKGQVALSPFEEGWWVVSDYATHPKQTRGWWENTTCFCWQRQVSLPTRRQACSTSFKKIENKIHHWKCWPCNGKCDILNCRLYAIMPIHWPVS